jgi:hypothetical protein
MRSKFNPDLQSSQVTEYVYSKYGSYPAAVTHCHTENTTVKDLGTLRKCIASMEHSLKTMKKNDDPGSTPFRDQMITMRAIAEEIALDTQKITELKLGNKIFHVLPENVVNNDENKSTSQEYDAAGLDVSMYSYSKYGSTPAVVHHNHPENPTFKDLPRIEGCIAYMQALKNNIPLYHYHGSAHYSDGLVTINVIEEAIARDIEEKDKLETRVFSVATSEKHKASSKVEKVQLEITDVESNPSAMQQAQESKQNPQFEVFKAIKLAASAKKYDNQGKFSFFAPSGIKKLRECNDFPSMLKILDSLVPDGILKPENREADVHADYEGWRVQAKKAC